MRERLDDADAQLLPLLLLVDRNILDVPHAAEPAEELALDEQRAGADDAVRLLVDDDERVVRVRRGAHGIELGDPGGFAEVGRDGEDGEDGEVAAPVVGGREGADLGRNGIGCEQGQRTGKRTWTSGWSWLFTSGEMRVAGKRRSSSLSGVKGIGVVVGVSKWGGIQAAL